MSEELKKFLDGKADGDAASIVNIKGGALVEMFDRALDRVLRNIGDINTTLAKRTVTLTLGVKPAEDRTFCEYHAAVTVNLAGQEGVSGTADIRMDERGRQFARERSRNRQLPGNILALDAKKGSGGK